MDVDAVLMRTRVDETLLALGRGAEKALRKLEHLICFRGRSVLVMIDHDNNDGTRWYLATFKADEVGMVSMLLMRSALDDMRSICQAVHVCAMA